MSASTSKRQTIREEALRLFAECGVDAVSVRDIATKCEMKAPNLYAHYESKEALVEELFKEGYADYGDALAEAACGKGPFRVRLDRMVRAICRLHDEDEKRFRFLIMAQHALLKKIPKDGRNPVEVICRAVAAAMEDGEIPRRDPVLMAGAVIGIIIQPATFRLYDRLQGDLVPRADEIVAMCWRMLS